MRQTMRLTAVLMEGLSLQGSGSWVGNSLGASRCCLKCFRPFPHAHDMARQRQAAAGFNQGNHSIEVRARMGTRDHDADRMKKFFPFCPGPFFYSIDHRLKALGAK